MSDDPYKALGLTKAATADEIKKAYRKLVRTSHPDINPGDAGAEARFKRISSAYDLLKDPQTRARFDAGEIDASGAEKPQRQYYRDFGQGGGPRSADFGGLDPNDLFAEILRQRGGGQRGQGQGFTAQGQDHAFALEVPFLDAVRGGTSRITLPGGEGMDVSIPAGLRDGQTLRLRGKGGDGYGGGARGDALVTVSIKDHPVFRRDGDDILVTLPITIDEAVLGAKVEAPTIHGSVGLTIPKGAKTGQILRLRGRGVKRAGKTGDQLVDLRIVMPKDADGKLAAFLEEWRKTHADNPRAAMMKGAAP